MRHSVLWEKLAEKAFRQLDLFRRRFYESQFLHLFIPRETLTSLTVKSALAIRVAMVPISQVMLWVYFQIRPCIAKHLSFLSRVRLGCHHSQNNVCWKLVAATLLFIKPGNWLQVSLKCQVQTGFQAYSSKKKEKMRFILSTKFQLSLLQLLLIQLH